MASDVAQTNGRKSVEPNLYLSLEEARLLNGLLNSTGFKGSIGKRIAYGAQEKIEALLPAGEVEQ
jgi:hypothetical protein